ncbi:MAG: hypothetical protein ACJ79S_13330 [Gemmatimonadaceae bacterium]
MKRQRSSRACTATRHALGRAAAVSPRHAAARARSGRAAVALASLATLASLSAAGCRGASPADAATSSPATVATDDRFRATVDSGAGVLTLAVGPLHLGPRGDAGAMVVAAPRAVALPIDGWLRGVSVDVVDADGRRLPRALLHHMNLIAPERRELFSPIMLRVGAAGPETAPIELPRVLGYRVRRGDSLLVTAMLDNPEARPREGVHVLVHLRFTKADSRFPPVDVFPLYLDVMPPAGVHAYDLPPGRSERSWEGRPAVAGRILALGGHLHRYGVALRLRDVTADELLWEARPARDASSGEAWSVPSASFLWRLGIPVRPDHTYRVTAVYDNPTGQVIPDGAMGTVGGVFRPAAGAVWPAVSRADPQYRLDLRVTYDTTGMPEGMSRGMSHDVSRATIDDMIAGGVARSARRRQLPAHATIEAKAPRGAARARALTTPRRC